MKSVCMWSFSGPYFPAFGLNTERYSVSLRIQSECGKIRTRKFPNTDTFHAVEGVIRFFCLKFLEENNSYSSDNDFEKFAINMNWKKDLIARNFLRMFLA